MKGKGQRQLSSTPTEVNALDAVMEMLSDTVPLTQELREKIKQDIKKLLRGETDYLALA